MSQAVFPAIYSTLDPAAIATWISQQYEIDPVDECWFWHRGLSDIYVVNTPQQKYILRISHRHWRSHSDILFELEFLDFIHQHGLPVSYPIKTKDKQLLGCIDAGEGTRYAALFPYAAGEVAIGDVNATQSQLLGKTVAKIHQLGDKFQPSELKQPLDLSYLLDNSVAKITPFLQHRPNDLNYLEKTASTLQTQLEVLPDEFPYWCVCWGDPHSGNVHFTNDHSLTLFDFDQCGYGWRAFDIAKFLQVSLSSGTCKHIRDAFLSGYNMVAPLCEWETGSFQAFTQIAHLWNWAIVVNHAQLFNYCRLDDSYFTLRLERLKRLQSSNWQLF